MTPTILVAFGALVVASLVGALLAPSDYSPRQTFLRSQWSTHPHRLGCTGHGAAEHARAAFKRVRQQGAGLAISARASPRDELSRAQ
jgi:hypothetical protein